MEVALDPPALLVGGSDDPPPRLPHLGELPLGLDLEPCVLEREPGRGRDPLDEARLVEQRRVVDERRDRFAALVEPGHSPLPTGLRKDELHAGLVDELAALRKPEGELERRVPERPDERGAKIAGRRALELDDEIADSRPGEPRPQEPREQHEGQRGQRGGLPPEQRGRGDGTAAGDQQEDALVHSARTDREGRDDERGGARGEARGEASTSFRTTSTRKIAAKTP